MNPTAFPSHGSMGEVAHEGMTLRDYFAAEAMSMIRLSAAPEDIVGYHDVDGFRVAQTHADIVAERAYLLADAMLKARDA